MANIKHNLSKHSLYGTWSDIKKRCLCKTYKEYYLYGGRGIKIYDKWLDFKNFLNDMGERPSNFHTIDRIDNNGNYEPSNCRWSSKKEQSRNRRNNRVILYKNKKQCLSAWCEELDLDYKLILPRIARGWSAEKAFNTKVRDRVKLITYKGETKGLVEWAKLLNIPHRTLSERFSRKWSVEDAFTIPNIKGCNNKLKLQKRSLKQE